jgi:EAL domain-containing protein (putative c-di-GMP-specific phosphodiesterase class I)/sensor domain CHASE-containing protein
LARSTQRAAGEAAGAIPEMGAPIPAERPAPFGRRPLRSFALYIGLPTFLLYVCSALLAMLALVIMAREMDTLENSRGVSAVNAALGSILHNLSDAVVDEGAWNDAYLNVVAGSNPAWMDNAWGATARLGTSYNDVLVTNDEGRIIFGENAEGSIRGEVGDLFAGAATMLANLNDTISASGDAAVVSSFVRGETGTVALAAVSIHKTTPGEMTVPRHLRRILWIARDLTPRMLTDLSIRYYTPTVHLVDRVPPGHSAITVRDPTGRPAGTFAWEPDRPGDAAMNRSLFTVALAFFAIGILVVIGLRTLRRTIVARAAEADRAYNALLRLAPAAPPVESAPEAEIPATPVPEPEPEELTALSAVDLSDFALDYQPVFDTRAERIVAADILLRWSRPDRSILRQEDLTHDELAVALDQLAIMALRHAIGDVAPLMDVPISFPITPAQLLGGLLVEKIAGTLGGLSFPARRLQLALDATDLPPAEMLAPVLSGLRRSGITVSLCGFVLGTRTLDYLRPGLADRIVLTAPLTAGLDQDRARLSLVEATIGAARAASLDVVVSGVARREDLAQLVRLGCRDFAGPLLAAPMPVGSFTTLLTAAARRDTRRAG